MSKRKALKTRFCEWGAELFTDKWNNLGGESQKKQLKHLQIRAKLQQEEKAIFKVQ